MLPCGDNASMHLLCVAFTTWLSVLALGAVENPFRTLHFPSFLKSSISSLEVSAAKEIMERCNFTPYVYVGEPEDLSIILFLRGSYWDTL